MRKRNGFVSFLKFFFISCIVLYHYGKATINKEWFFLKGSAILTDFFFIVSGYYLAYNTLKETCDNLGEKSWKFIFNKIKKLYPYLLIGFVLNLIIKILYFEYTIPKIVNTFGELLLLKASGFLTTSINGPSWFVSAMILSMFILYPLLVKYKEKYIYLISPVIVVFGIGYISRLPKTFGTWSYWDGYFMKGFLRGFVEINLGSIFYILVNKLNKVRFTKFGKGFLSTICATCLIIVLYVVAFVSGTLNYNLFLLFLIMVGTMLALSDQTIFKGLFDQKLFFLLEKISLPLFLIHYAIKDLFACLFNDCWNYYIYVAIYYLSSLIVSFAVYYIVEYFKNKKIIIKIKKMIIEI